LYLTIRIKVSFGVLTAVPDGEPQLLRGIFRHDQQVGYWDGE
jgi:hypothetical protein